MAAILLIDDMKGVRESLAMILEKAGHQVTQAAEGAQGLSAAAGGKFDLVITDILMPQVDGTEVIMQLRDSARLSRTPILAISGGGADVPAEEALKIAESFADEVMPKPFSRDDILAAVTRLTAAA